MAVTNEFIQKVTEKQKPGRANRLKLKDVIIEIAFMLALLGIVVLLILMGIGYG